MSIFCLLACGIDLWCRISNVKDFLIMFASLKWDKQNNRVRQSKVESCGNDQSCKLQWCGMLLWVDESCPTHVIASCRQPGEGNSWKGTACHTKRTLSLKNVSVLNIDYALLSWGLESLKRKTHFVATGKITKRECRKLLQHHQHRNWNNGYNLAISHVVHCILVANNIASGESDFKLTMILFDLLWGEKGG